jgi:hypothetical protein
MGSLSRLAFLATRISEVTASHRALDHMDNGVYRAVLRVEIPGYWVEAVHEDDLVAVLLAPVLP